MSDDYKKLLTDFQRLMGQQNFENIEDAQAFMSGLIGKVVPSVNKEALTPKEQAQDLVFEADKLPVKQAKEKLIEALKLDPDCIEVYEFLGDKATDINIAISRYKTGIDIGRRIFGGEYLEKNRGHFWMIHETRPYMRCLHQYADCLYKSGKPQDSIAIYEALLVLNPNDNQGVRDHLSLIYIEHNELDKYVNLDKKYDDTILACPTFNRALHAFKVHGENKIANDFLKHAISRNKYVVKYLINNKPFPKPSAYYSLGDDSEALFYGLAARNVWMKTEGAVSWLKKHANADK
jgi:tetratricopeptide (TPR) repeat protein